MSELLNNTLLNIDLPLLGTNKKTENKKKSGIQAGFSGVTTNAFSVRLNTNSQGMKPFELLEELAKLRIDEISTKEEKIARIQKMLEME